MRTGEHPHGSDALRPIAPAARKAGGSPRAPERQPLTLETRRPEHGDLAPVRAEALELRRQLADQAFARAAGAPLSEGHRVDLLEDGAQNYPAWQAAIAAARRTVHLEMYIFSDDAVGREFAELLMQRAREGVRVRVLYDWLGCFGRARAGFWQRLRAAGCEVRCFNPPRLGAPLAWIHRDHRKLLVCDGEVAFLSGLCIGREWLADPATGRAAWRDTGVRLVGPAVADAQTCFARLWASCGEALPPDEAPARAALPPAGDVAVRLIAGSPESARLFRLDLLVAGLARHSLWITDAYFVGGRAYVDALGAAALAGVDVRLLVPGTSDVPSVAALARTLYRPLLEAGVRVFEWNGPMVHAKTAVADGRWARVGSSNLNPSSWFGNWELDLAIENTDFALALEASFLRDLAHATEITLRPQRRLLRGGAPPNRGGGGARNRVRSAATTALRLRGAMSAALARSRDVDRSESGSLARIGASLLLVGALGLLLPEALAWPLSALALVSAGAALFEAWRLRRQPDPDGD